MAEVLPINRLRKQDRHARILESLSHAPTLRVHELADALSVSTETIRRDLAALDEQGLLSRTYGGAARASIHEPGVAEREALFIDERRRVANLAVATLEPNDIVMIGGGATTLHFARRLAMVSFRLTVITHAFSVAAAIAGNPLIKVMVLPGQYDGHEGLISGADTIEAINQFRADKAYVGATGITVDGPCDASRDPGLVYGAMTRRASHSFVLADSSKFDRTSLMVFAVWSPNLSLISEVSPSGALLDQLCAQDVSIITEIREDF